MVYTTSNFTDDVTKTARALHLSFRRCQFLLNRWYAGMNTTFTGDAEMENFMVRVEEMVNDYTANSSAKLNTVMAKSDLVLPGDTTT